MKLPPLIAILRGLTKARARETGEILYQCGFRALEVPLNREGAFEAMTVLADSVPGDCLVGAGTVLSVDAVDESRERGARLIVAPNCDERVVARSIERNLIVIPGVATPTEAFRALQLGASALKAFPAATILPAGVHAWRSVLPPEAEIFAVGGVTVETMAAFVAAGASGFGLGRDLYQPELSTGELAARAHGFTAALSALQVGMDGR